MSYRHLQRSVLFCSLLFALLAGVAAPARAATFTVNTTTDTDDGVCDAAHCSLREAINAANAASGADDIAFAITPAGAVHVITVGSILPDITGDLVIDGYTQSGATANTQAIGGLDAVLKIELRSPHPTAVTLGLGVAAPRVTIRGLAIVNFLTAIYVASATQELVLTGNFLGTDATGLAGGGSEYGLYGYLKTVRIGGPAPADRNLIASISRQAATFMRNDATPALLTVQGNLWGTDVTGQTALGDSFQELSIDIPSPAQSSTNDRVLIGGSTPAEGNVFAGPRRQILMTRNGSDPAGASTVIANNTIGTDPTRTVAFPSNADAITLSGPFHARVEQNYIANSGGAAIRVTGGLTAQGTGTRITNNTIVDNAGLGIDLGGSGRTANDPGDADTGPNALLNYPYVMRAAVDTVSDVAILRGTVEAEPSTFYEIELFNLGAVNRPDGSDAANRFHTFSLTTDATGHAEFNHQLPANGLQAGHKVVATLTNVTHGYTSEISETATVVATGPAIRGQITRDGVAPLGGVSVRLMVGTTLLLATVSEADGSFQFLDLFPGATYEVIAERNGYNFLPASRTVPNLTTSVLVPFAAQSVPAIYTVNVDYTHLGDGQCDATECTLREAIDEANVHPGADTIRFAIPGAGPHVLRSHTTLSPIADDLMIDGYTQPGAAENTNATGGLNGTLRIALAPDAPGTADYGLVVIGGRVVIRGLAIGGFASGALVYTLASTPEVTFEGNYFGTTSDGLSGIPNSSVGIEGMGHITIGGSTPAARNLFAGHTASGIVTFAGRNGRPSIVAVRGSLIGTDATGLRALPNAIGLHHIGGQVDAEADQVRIGGETVEDANVISGNDQGIVMARLAGSDADTADQLIAGNLIGVAADGVTPLGNTLTALGFCGPVRYRVERNTIAHNGSAGVRLCTSPTTGGFGVALLGNRIFENFGLAIDLEADGRTPNDPDDGLSTAANRRQNFPVLTQVNERVNGARIRGTLASRPNREYLIELFSTGGSGASGIDARELVDSFTVTTDGAGDATFTRLFAAAFPADESFVATATDTQAMMTSEVSDARPIAALMRVQITGTITRDGAPLAGVRVTLSGDRADEQVTDAHGRYVFGALPITGHYIVTPGDAAYIFTPASAEFLEVGPDAVADFSATSSTFTRYLTEGAAGPFWETSIALLNASNVATTATLSFLLPGGQQETATVPLTGPGHAIFDPATIPALNGATFSTVVTSAQPLVASRTMRWGDRKELGAHAEQALAEPRRAWYFGEGATGCFDLFYQLVNPGATAAEVDIMFLRRAPLAPITRHYTVAAGARETVRVNAEEGLAFAEVSARITVANDAPIVAERTMYASCHGTSWGGGHDAVASEAPAREWFFAEGATGSFFDLYLLLANFETRDARVDIEYLLADGSTIKKPYTVPAGSRVTIDVAGEAPQLAQAAVSAIVRSRNDVPIVAERSQWWPHGAWYEGHASAGVTASGVEWQVAGAQLGGAHEVSGYLLIANTGDRAGQARVRAVLADGTTVALAQPLPLEPHSRATVDLADAFPQAIGQSFGLIVESLGAGPDAPAPIVVELSSYNDTISAAGTHHFWGAGTNIVATRIR